MRIKPLEWFDAGAGLNLDGSWHTSGVSEYLITLREGVFEAFFSGRYSLGKFGSLDEAKADAQADCEYRIRAAVADYEAERAQVMTQALQEIITICTESAGASELRDTKTQHGRIEHIHAIAAAALKGKWSDEH